MMRHDSLLKIIRLVEPEKEEQGRKIYTTNFERCKNEKLLKTDGLCCDREAWKVAAAN